MKQITISTENCETYSSISNFFIDYYMTEANGEFVKVYLYLIRLLNKERSISVAEIADHFNLTENDICRAIKYWIGKDVLRLNYDGRGQLSGIVLLPLSAPAERGKESWDAISILNIGDSQKPDAKEASASSNITPITAAGTKPSRVQTPKEAASVAAFPQERELPAKPHLSPAAMNEMEKDEDWKDILYQVETLFAKQVSTRDMESLLYIYNDLHFDLDLFEYLIEYCVTLNKKNCKYMEAVAINWYKENITTVTEAKESSQMVTGLLKSVYKELGIRRSYPTNMEMNFLDTWTKKLGFSDDLVILAAQKAMLTRPGSANFPYVNGILEHWYKNKVTSRKDVDALDAAFAAKQAREIADKKSGGSSTGSFQSFKQSDDSDALAEMERLFLKEVGNK